MLHLPTVASLGLIAGILLILRYWYSRTTPLPPGPKPLPLIGNVHQLPKERDWLTYAKWAETYGDIIYIRALGQPIILLSSYQAAHELLEKRSAIYSSRPRLVMAGELFGIAKDMIMMPYCPQFQKMRRVVHREFTGTALQKYHPLYEQESRLLAANLLKNPKKLFSSIRHYSGSVIMRVAYGYKTSPENDPYLDLAEEVMQAVSKATKPGGWLVDIIPWLRYIPSWFPGASFKRTAARWKELHGRLGTEPYQWTKAHQNSPLLVNPNFVSTVLASKDAEGITPEDEYTLMRSACSMFGGGSDTTVSAITSFVLCMALHPSAQKRAQEEIETLTGGKRLPLLSDVSSLPYVQCVVREVMRWNPVGPMGFPHLLNRDDIYQGYHIPKGSIVMANAWSILHDPDVFPAPAEFRPERFLDNEAAIRSAGVAFGYGRRVCPGMSFAELSMFIAMATCLATCDISDAVDPNGVPLNKDVEWRSGLISHPKDFLCKIEPRSELSLDLLRSDA